MTDTKTVTAPVSLAAIKARKASLVSGLIGMTEEERDRLVELAEAYLEWRDFDKRPKGMGFGGEELQHAHERLALAAKGLRP